MKEENEEKYEAWIIVFYLLYRSDELEWDTMRELAIKPKNKNIIVDYFDRLFDGNFNVEEIPCDTHFFRARQIKEEDSKDLGVNIICSNDLSSLKKECDKINKSSEGITIDFSDFLLLKSFVGDEEREKLIEIIAPLLEKLKSINFLGFDELKSGPPPKDKIKEGRLNTIDDNFLYLGYDIDTTLAEMKPIINQEYNVAECVTTKNLRIINLHNLNSSNQKNLFSKFYVLSKKVSEPNIEPNPENEKFYKITQILSHYLKSKGFDGISYKSSSYENGINLVLFDANNVKFINSKIMRIKNVKVEFEDEADTV